MAAAAPLLWVHSSASVKLASFPTKSVKAAAAVILQTRNNIPWHCNSELSSLSSFAFHFCSLAEEVLRCHLPCTSGQHWQSVPSLGRLGMLLPIHWECPDGNLLCPATGSERRNKDLRGLGLTGADSVPSVLFCSMSRPCANREWEFMELLGHSWAEPAPLEPYAEYFQLLSDLSGNLG